jgi:hypothetical protein
LARGFTQHEYNALLHSIWDLDRRIEDLAKGGYKPEDYAKLTRDRKALSDLFVRLG